MFTAPQSGRIGTPLTEHATRVMLLGAGELGKEVTLELQRLGAEVIAVDRYANAPAMQVAQQAIVVDMFDAQALHQVITEVKPHLILPEVEAIATEVLTEVEQAGVQVAPTARAVQLTMDREGIRRLAAETLGLPTSPYIFTETWPGFQSAVEEIGFPCVVKPVMSSSGKGQSVIRGNDDVERAWEYAQSGGRAPAQHPESPVRVIVEGFVDFDYEITLLTLRSKVAAGPNSSQSDQQAEVSTTFCPPIGHVQLDGDYRESWSPAEMSPAALAKAQALAQKVTTALGGLGLFGVELFVKSDEVIFSEVSPRPHDTGMVTMVGQDVSEFGLHARAVLGLPVETPNPVGGAGQEYSASHALVVTGRGIPVFHGVDQALAVPTAQVRLFGKPYVNGTRRVGVTLARGATVAQARARAAAAASALQISLV